MILQNYTQYYKIPYLDIKQFNPVEENIFGEEDSSDAFKIFTKRFALKVCGIPIENYDDVISVVVSEPSLELKEKIEKYTKKVVRFIKSHEQDILNKIKELY